MNTYHNCRWVYKWYISPKVAYVSLSLVKKINVVQNTLFQSSVTIVTTHNHMLKTIFQIYYTNHVLEIMDPKNKDHNDKQESNIRVLMWEILIETQYKMSRLIKDE